MGLTKASWKEYEALRGLRLEAEILEFREALGYLDLSASEIERTLGTTKIKGPKVGVEKLEASPFVPIYDGDLAAYASACASSKMLYGMEDDTGRVVVPLGDFKNKREAQKIVEQQNAFSEEHGSARTFSLISKQQSEPVEYAVYTLKKLLEGVEAALLSDRSNEVIIITGETKNFRKSIDPEYKISRKDSPKPPHLDSLKDYLKDNRRCIESAGCEADDYACPAAVSVRLDGYIPVYVTKDKDWNQLWGWHYNWTSRTLEFVSVEEAIHLLFSQIIQGDRVDDIKGIPKYGPKKSESFLHKVKAEKAPPHGLPIRELWELYHSSVSELYEDHGLGYAEFKKTASLVYLWRKLPDQFPPAAALPTDIAIAASPSPF